MPDRKAFWRFVLLSFLLHVFLVLLFADANRAEPRAGVLWGRMNVVLNKLAGNPSATPPSPSLKPAPANIPRSTPAKSSASKETPAAPPTPPVPALPELDARPPETSAEPLMQRVVPKPADALRPLPQTQAPPMQTLPESVTRVEVPAAAPLAPIAPITPPQSERVLTLPSETATRFEPVLPAPIAPLSPPAPANLRSVEVMPEAAVRVEAPAAPILKPLEPARPAPTLAPLPEAATRVEVPATAVPLAPLAPAAPAPAQSRPMEIESAQRVEAPAAQPLQPLAPPAASTSQPIQRLPDELPSRVQAPPVETLTPLAPTQVGKPINRLLEAPDPSSLTAPQAAPGVPPANMPLGVPGGSTAPDAQAPANARTPSRLDPEALRQRARELARDPNANSRNSLFAGPRLPPKTKEQEIFDKALKEKDCKTAYADMGLLAVAPLVASALSEERKCKWGGQ